MHRFMGGEFVADASDKGGSRRYAAATCGRRCGPDISRMFFAGDVLDVQHTAFAAALDQGDDRALLRPPNGLPSWACGRGHATAASAFRACRDTFVRLDNLALAAERGGVSSLIASRMRCAMNQAVL